MFSRGTSELIDRLPSLDGLTGEWARRRLSSAYLDLLAAKELLRVEGHGETRDDIRRLVNALELYALRADGGDEHVAAAAFVAAEGLDISSSSASPEDLALLRIEAALLFVIGGFDANAAAITPSDELLAEGLKPGERWCLGRISDLLAQRAPSLDDPAVEEEIDRVDAIANALWRRIGAAVRSHHLWLRGDGESEESPGRGDLEELVSLLHEVPGAASAYAPQAHLAALLQRALRAMEGRALRRLRGIPGLAEYVDGTALRRPLLWPGAERYAATCLDALNRDAAVVVPTGSGKSAIAELAVVRGLSGGWCLYLAPTNALVGQIRRDLRPAVSRAGGEIRTFVGGGEYTTEETLSEAVSAGDVFVMTPEKCALALRQAPSAFEQLRLLVVDECHLIGAGGTRGVMVELVVAEILARAGGAATLLMSALVSNARELAEWLSAATGKESVAIEEPWRPTRTLRGVVGIEQDSFVAARAASEADLAARPHNVFRRQVQLSTMVGLQGAWATTGAADDFAVVGLPASVQAQFRVADPEGDVESWRNRAAEAVSVALARTGEHVLTFVPANKHEVITVARAIAAEGTDRTLDDQIEHLIALAEYELGAPSEVGELLRRGVATHSAAIIDEERRASELAFSGRSPSAPVIVATTSLAQGLNLPATVVVIAGTQIGQGGQGGGRTARDLLNAIGRAGRPFVANRSLALIVPSEAGLLPLNALPANVLSVARFIGLEDASTPLESHLLSLLRREPERLASLDSMTEEELAAFTYLPLSGDDLQLGENILERTLGHHQRRSEISPTNADTLEALRALGLEFLRRGETPRWLVNVAYVSGLDLRGIAAMYRVVARRESTPASVTAWASAMLTWIRELSWPARELFCALDDVPQPLLRGLRRGEEEAWEAFDEAATAYVGGHSLAAVGEAAFKVSREDGRRSSGDPLPKAIGLVRQMLSYRLSMAAGALYALFLSGIEQEDSALQIDEKALAALEALPLSLRVGCAPEHARLWARYGGTGRRVSHLLGRLRPVPGELETEAALRSWTRTQLTQLADETEVFVGLEDRERRALVATVARAT